MPAPFVLLSSMNIEREVDFDTMVLHVFPVVLERERKRREKKVMERKHIQRLIRRRVALKSTMGGSSPEVVVGNASRSGGGAV